jgi:cytochrome c-type biogenesis protein CcmH
MNQFAFFAALLGLLAVAFAVSALWRGSRKLALALALGLPLAAAGLYHLTGNPAALNPAVVLAPSSIEDAVVQLQQRLASQPDNFEGLALLGRSYMALEKYDLARDAYAKAVKLQPEDSDLAVEYAEALLRTSADRRFPPEAVRLLEAAVARNPDNQRALFFLGTHQMQENRPADAAATWEKLLPKLDAETAAELRKQIDVARLAAGQPALAPATDIPAASATATAPGLNIDVGIDPTLARLARPGDVLYVFARALDGAGPPFAVKRIELAQLELPMRVLLTDADSPMPAARLSSQTKVLLMARLSKSGDVKAASGDIESDPVQVATAGQEPVQLVLSRSVP